MHKRHAAGFPTCRFCRIGNSYWIVILLSRGHVAWCNFFIFWSCCAGRLLFVSMWRNCYLATGQSAVSPDLRNGSRSSCRKSLHGWANNLCLCSSSSSMNDHRAWKQPVFQAAGGNSPFFLFPQSSPQCHLDLSTCDPDSPPNTHVFGCLCLLCL